MSNSGKVNSVSSESKLGDSRWYSDDVVSSNYESSTSTTILLCCCVHQSLKFLLMCCSWGKCTFSYLTTYLNSSDFWRNILFLGRHNQLVWFLTLQKKRPQKTEEKWFHIRGWGLTLSYISRVKRTLFSYFRIMSWSFYHGFCVVLRQIIKRERNYR